MFKVFDVNKNGVLEAKDFTSFFPDLARASGASSGEKYKEIRLVQLALWLKLRRFGDPNLDYQVNEDEWLKWANTLVNEIQQPSNNFQRFYQAGFNSLDRDNDGIIGLDEYQIWFSNFQLNGSPEVIFNRLDTKGDGKITKNEFVQLGIEYYSDDSSVAGNYLWGEFS